MDLDTLRNQPGGRELSAMTYWRRRFLALTAGLGILSLIVWALSGALGASGAGGATPAGRAHPSRGHAGKAAAGPGRRGSGGTSAGARARPSATARQPAAASGGHSPQAGHGQDTQAQARAPATRLARTCKPGDVVLSLFSGQDSYGKGQLPEFDVDVVSTSATPCAFDLGSAHLSLVVRAGRKRVWGSADCVTGGGTLSTDLARGVPAIVPISWDLQTSARGCQGTSRRAPAGSYTAEASGGGLASDQVRFTVR
jgi:hypothetical protein